METITVAASRGNVFSLTEMETMVGTALVVVLIAWALLARTRRDRQPHA